MQKMPNNEPAKRLYKIISSVSMPVLYPDLFSHVVVRIICISEFS